MEQIIQQYEASGYEVFSTWDNGAVSLWIYDAELDWGREITQSKLAEMLAEAEIETAQAIAQAA